MYKDSKRTYTAIVLLIKPFVWWRSRCRCRRGFVNSLLSVPRSEQFPESVATVMSKDKYSSIAGERKIFDKL